MKIGVEIKIDMNKIDNSRVFVGQKGAYLSLTAFIDLDNKDQYNNNGFITASLTKEEREQKVQLPILGNSKVFWSDAPQQAATQQYQAAPQQPAPQQAAPQQQPPQTSNPYGDDFDDDIPF